MPGGPTAARHRTGTLPGKSPLRMHMGTATEFPSMLPPTPLPSGTAPPSGTALPSGTAPPNGTAQSEQAVFRPPDEIARGLFSRGRRFVRTHPLASDSLLAAVLLTLSSVWLAGVPFSGVRPAVVQTALIAAL